MHVPHNALIVVADGRKMLLLRNEGDEEYLNLQLERKELHEAPKDAEQPSTEADYPLQDENRFAADVADMLKCEAQAKSVETLIVAAPPRTLGELRKHYHKDVQARITGEIGKDLTGHTLPQIEEALLHAP